MATLPQVLALKALEGVINRTLRFDAGTRARLSALHGRRVWVQLERPALSFLIRLDDQVYLHAESEAQPDATVEAATLDLLRQAVTGTDFAIGGPIQVRGDTGLVQQLAAIARDLDIDWEEALSQLMGDVAAHRLGQQVRGALSFGRRLARTFFQNSGEFLREEMEVVPVRWEVDELHQDVDDLRADTDRLEARLARLGKRLDALESTV